MAFDVFTPGKGQSPFKRFQELFGADFDGFGTSYGNPAAIVPELLRRVMLRRRRTEVLPNLPSKTYTALTVGDLDAKLKKQLDEMWDEIGTQLEVEDSLPPFEKFSEIRAKLAKANIPTMLDYVEQCGGTRRSAGGVQPLTLLPSTLSWGVRVGGHYRRNIGRKASANC
jgi:hypothetical protein